ncbi:MAG: YhdP family protein [Gammaproteobacteria bacterium]
MIVWLHRIYRTVLYTAAVSVILLAVLFSVAHALLPQLPQYRHDVERQFGALMGQPVKIRRLDASWHLLGPRLVLRNVRLYDQSGQHRVLAFRRAILDFNLFAMLLHLELKPTGLTIYGANFDIQRLKDNRIRVTGLNLSESEQQAIANEDPFAAINNINFSLLESRIHWQDRQTGADYIFDPVDLSVRVDSDGFGVSGVVGLPKTLGRRLDLVARIDGKLDQPKGWDARIYAKGDGIRLQGIPEQALIKRAGIKQGVVDARFWANWSQGQLVSLSGDGAVTDLALTSRNRPANGLTGVSGKFLWSSEAQGWRLSLDDFQLQRDGQKTRPAALLLVSHLDDTGRSYQLSAADVNIGDTLAAVLPYVKDRLPKSLPLEKLAPQGAIQKVVAAAHIPAEGAPTYRASGVFQGISVKSLKHTPGIDSLDGQFSLTQQGGSVLLRSKHIDVDYPMIFSHRVSLDHLEGEIGWHREKDGWNVYGHDLAFGNQDIKSQGQFTLVSHGTASPELDLQLKYRDGDAAKARQYLPDHVIPADAMKWLKQAFVAGHVTDGALVFHGRLKDFPYHGNEGVFETRFHVENAVLNVERGWPALQGIDAEVVFRNAAMHIDATRAKVFDTELSNVHVAIPKLAAPVLDIQGTAHGPLQDVFRYLAASPLSRGREKLLADVRAQGTSDLKLRLTLPLNHTLAESSQVDGKLQLKGADLGLASEPVKLTQLQGEVDFGRGRLAFSKLSGQFRGAPIVLDAHTTAKGVLQVGMRAHLTAAQLLQNAPKGTADYLDGDSDWEGRLTIPLQEEKQGGGAVLTLASDLRGTAVNLPAPLHKPVGASRSVIVSIPLAPDQTVVPVSVRYGRSLQAVLGLADSNGRRHVVAAGLSFNDGVPALPKQGVRITGRLTDFSLQPWLGLAEGKSALGEGAKLPQLKELDVSLDGLRAYGQNFKNVNLKVRRGSNAWEADVQSSLVSGHVTVPYNLHTAQPLKMDLQKLSIPLPKGEKEAQGEEMHVLKSVRPAKLPPLEVRAKQFKLGSYAFRDLHLSTTSDAQGMQIHLLQLGGEYLHAKASGSWSTLSDGRQKTSLHVDIKTDNLARTTENLNLHLGLRDGKTTLTGNLSWPGAPWQLGWKGLRGEGSFEIRDGRIEKIEPGVGRLLSLINLSALPKRLTLNFSDVFSQGYSFNKASGNFRLVDGDVFTHNTLFEGSGADIAIQGRIGLQAQDYDAKVAVTPQLTSTLPIAGALFGGLGVGAALMILENTLGIGKRIDESAIVRYTVMGPWNNPKVTPLNETPPKNTQSAVPAPGGFL